jgi:NADP-dependent 3-hydroxy acid dehydrogenase YdfG
VIALVNNVKEMYGRIDILFNNAGIGFGGKYKQFAVIDLDAHDWQGTLNINLNGVFYFTKHVLPIMIEQKSGSIINNTSTAALIGQPSADAYTANPHPVPCKHWDRVKHLNLFVIIPPYSFPKPLHFFQVMFL